MAIHKAAPSEGQFRIRAGRRGDAEQIAVLFAELGYPNAPDSSSVHWVISHPEMEVIVAADALDKAVGVVTLSHRPQLRMKGRIATIDELVVATPWRQKGVGKALVKRAIERAKILSVKRIELLTHGETTSELGRFFDGLGFRQEPGIGVFRLVELDFQRGR